MGMFAAGFIFDVDGITNNLAEGSRIIYIIILLCNQVSHRCNLSDFTIER